MDRFWNKVDRTNDCWEWTASKRPKGYGQFSLDGRNVSAHRVAWELVNGPIPAGMHCLHRCDNPGCVNPDHLFLGTNQDNMTDKVSKGRSLKGSMVPSAKIKESDVVRIRRMSKGGLSQRKIAARVAISQTQVGCILRGKYWRQQ